jgi:Rrf2 family protein
VKLQKATRYGLYAVLELARDPARQLSAADIAEIYDISANHLAKVLRDLGRAGLVDAVRGAGGGYRFSGNAKRTTLLDVIGLFEEISDDRAAGRSGARDREPATAIGESLDLVLAEIDDIARATFGSITLDTMLKNMRRRGERARRLREGQTAAE